MYIFVITFSFFTIGKIACGNSKKIYFWPFSNLAWLMKV